jgi:hypothetical protein
MFSLDQAIMEWRRRMIAGGIKAESVLDELESHLREDVERQMRSGINQEQAFDAAARRIGKGDALNAEFAKVSVNKAARVGKVLGIACCLVTLPFSVLAAPRFLTVPELTAGQRLLGLIAVLLTFLSIASWRFSHRFLPVIANQKIRMATAIACGVAGLAWLYIFGALLPTVILPRLFSVASTGELRPVFAMAIAVLWAMALTAVLGALAYGLEGAAQRKKENAYV